MCIRGPFPKYEMPANLDRPEATLLNLFLNWKGESLVSVVWLSSNPVTGQSKFKRGLHSKADWKECPLKFVFIVIHNICMGQFHSPATPPIISYSSWLYSMTEIGKIQPVRMGRRLWKGEYVCICTETGPFSSSPFVLVFPLKIADLVVQKLHFTAFLNLDKDREWGLWAVFGINWEESKCISKHWNLTLVAFCRWAPGPSFSRMNFKSLWEYRIVRVSHRL